MAIGGDRNRFALRVSHEVDTHVIEVYGDVDAASARLLAARIEEGEETTAARVLVDLSGVDSIAPAGIAALVEADARSRRNGHRLALLRAPDPVQELLERVGLANRLPFID